MRSLAPSLMLLFSSFVTSTPAPAADLTPALPSFAAETLSVESTARRSAEEVSERASHRRWKISLAPVFASQTLDVASSYGMRELNPMLAGPDGRFGSRAAGIKLGAAAGLAGVEYLIVRKYPRTSRVFSKINWSLSIVTTGFAVHNFAIR